MATKYLNSSYSVIEKWNEFVGFVGEQIALPSNQKMLIYIKKFTK